MKFFVLFLFAACSIQSPVLRTDYKLTRTKDFIVSNIYVDPNDLDSNKGSMVVPYSLIVKNVSLKDKDINLETASVSLGEKKFPIKCLSFQGKEVKFKIAPRAQARIDCLITFSKKEDIAPNDYKALIEVPLSGETTKFNYLIRREDFQ